MSNLFLLASNCLTESDIEKKIDLSNSIVKDFRENNLTLEKDLVGIEILKLGVPDKLKLVPAKSLPRRKFSTSIGKVAMLHALAHIEFNAINIAWDAICRFREMPDNYYRDWIKIAHEETHHFCLLLEHLHERNYEYGDFDGHDGLWRMVEKTRDDPLVRMAIIPRVYEARGLDVSSEIIRKFEEVGEKEVTKTMLLIYEDEVGHVSIGNRWFKYLCNKRGIDSALTFIKHKNHVLRTW